MGDFSQDLRYALRRLARSPGFAGAIVLTMALGIGLNSAVFSVVNAVLLRPLQLPEADRLVAIEITLRGQSWWSASTADIFDWRSRSQVLEEVAFAVTVPMGLTTDAEPTQVRAAQVSTNFFDTLRVPPALGTGFADLAVDASEARSVVLTHGLWQRVFGGDPTLIGRSVELDGEPYDVVGIAGEDFGPPFLAEHDLYLARPLTADDLTNRGRLLRPVARLRPGITVAQAQADLDRVSAQVEADNPETMGGWGTRVIPLRQQIVGSVRPALVTLLGAVVFVLLVACANVGNLLVARGTTRIREVSLRRALGAGRGRIVRQLLTEAAVLAVIGGLLGLLMAWWATGALVAAGPGDIPRLGEIDVDVTVLAFTLVVSLLAAGAFGLLPAIALSGAEVQEALRQSATQASGTRGQIRSRSLLVAAEVALVFVLLVGAGLMVQSLLALTAVDGGFVSEGRLAVELTLPAAKYGDPDQRRAFYVELLDRLRALPGVRAAGSITSLPLVSSAGFTTYHLVDDRPDPPPGAEPVGGGEFVIPGYFEAMGMELISGRFLDATDAEDTVPVVVINDVAAELYWPDEDAMGQRMRFTRSGGGGAPPGADRAYEVVGIVRGVRYSLGSAVRPRVYVSLLQQSFLPTRTQWVVVATDSPEPASLVPAVRAALAEIDAEQPLGRVATLDALRYASMAQPRLQTVLLSVFGLTALALGIVGVYGVVSFAVARRTPELGVRLALGAGRSNVGRLVVLEAMVPILVGISVGIAGSLALSGMVSAQLFGVEGADPFTLVAISAVLLLAGLCATVVPGRRAMRLDPVVLLRAE